MQTPKQTRNRQITTTMAAAAAASDLSFKSVCALASVFMDTLDAHIWPSEALAHPGYQLSQKKIPNRAQIFAMLQETCKAAYAREQRRYEQTRDTLIEAAYVRARRTIGRMYSGIIREIVQSTKSTQQPSIKEIMFAEPSLNEETLQSFLDTCIREHSSDCRCRSRLALGEHISSILLKPERGATDYVFTPLWIRTHDRLKHASLLVAAYAEATADAMGHIADTINAATATQPPTASTTTRSPENIKAKERELSVYIQNTVVPMCVILSCSFRQEDRSKFGAKLTTVVRENIIGAISANRCLMSATVRPTPVATTTTTTKKKEKEKDAISERPLKRAKTTTTTKTADLSIPAATATIAWLNALWEEDRSQLMARVLQLQAKTTTTTTHIQKRYVDIMEQVVQGTGRTVPSDYVCTMAKAIWQCCIIANANKTPDCIETLIDADNVYARLSRAQKSWFLCL